MKIDVPRLRARDCLAGRLPARREDERFAGHKGTIYIVVEPSLKHPGRAHVPQTIFGIPQQLRIPAQRFTFRRPMPRSGSRMVSLRGGQKARQVRMEVDGCTCVTPRAQD